LAEKVSTTAEQLKKLIKKVSASYLDVADVQLVGSVAKDTYVGRPDIDIFILFDRSTDRARLEKIGLGIGNKVLLDTEERYAEHPYIHGIFNDFEVDIVPCYDIKNAIQLMSAVDRTPLHTQYVKEHLRHEQHDQVRLLKQFMKGIGAYGAEAKVQGFSGYLTELLVIKYGSFSEVLKASSQWNYGTKISLSEDEQARFSSALTFIDPVDPNRNVASAVSVEQFAKFVYACQVYLSQPSEFFFFPNRRRCMDEHEIRRYFKDTGFKVLVVSAPCPKGIDDNVYPQTRKTMEGIKVLLERHEFDVLDKTFVIDESATILFLLMTDKISICRKHVGPPVYMGNAEDFLKRWRGACIGEPYIEGGRWVVMIKRTHHRAKELLKEEISKASMGSGFKDLEFKVISHDDILTGDFGPYITELLDKRPPWSILVVHP
jgi:tRNA nucleotidyltransferase (CCA-adding enzyme)